VTWPEPFLLVAATYLVAYTARDSALDTVLPALVGGAILVLAGYGLIGWALWSWPALFTGHAILPDHQLVRTGAYGFVRHPVYVAAFLIWLGLGIAFRSAGVVALTAFYVVPAYLAYIRSEENMMREEFGDSYREYCRDVRGLIPRVR
jgi:protein-S-isoprenylcysteine O-methyltransferase Ste14